MGNSSGRISESSFSSSDDELLDFRFSSSQISAFFKSSGDIENLVPRRDYGIPVGYSGRFDGKLRKIIDNIVNIAFSEAEAHNLRLEYTDPKVEIFSPDFWLSANPDKKNSIPNLPASRIQWEGKTPVIELIIPEKISTSEEAVKIVRLLFSKLFGKLFFDEQAPGKEIFQSMSEERSALEFASFEKAKFCLFIDEFLPEENALFSKIGKQLKIAGNKARERGKKEFFNQFTIEDPSPPPEYQALLDKMFKKHLDLFQTDTAAFYAKLTNKIFNQFPQTNIIVPYDQLQFQKLKETQQWSVFHAITEKTGIGLSAINQLKDCDDYLKRYDNEKPVADFQEFDSWIDALNQRVVSLVKKGLVKPFLIEGAKLTEKQRRDKEQFPFWVWKHKIYEIDSKPRNMEKTVNKIINRYNNSVFQKTLELSVRFKQCLNHARGVSEEKATVSVDYTKSKPLMMWLDIRKPLIEDLHYACMVGSQLAKAVERGPIGKGEVYKKFEVGWSYFVSYALVHQYFQTIDKKPESDESKSAQFHKLIKKYAFNRIEDQPSFQIAFLLIRVYESLEFNLDKIGGLIREEAKALDFFILNQPLLFKNKSKSPEAIIDGYASNVVEWLDRER